MIILYIIISALIQSVTEFIPVSSSGHLVIWHYFITAPVNDWHLDIMLHFGSVLALIVFFWSDIVRIIKEWLKSLIGPLTPYGRLGWLLIVSSIPAFVIGYFFADMIEIVFRSPYWVIGMLIVVSVLFIVIEKFAKADQKILDINFKRATLIGLAQCIAFIPGTSRSGITIVTGMLCKIKRAEAARYSFLLAIPTILGASLRGFIIIASQGTTMSNMIMLIIGLFISFIFSFYVIKFFIQYLNNHSLYPFAWYRIALAIMVLLILSV